jgi:hypothetical protein
LKGADGVVRSGIPAAEVERTASLDGFALSGSRELRSPSAPSKVASRHLLNGRSHPSFAKEGNISEPASSETPQEVVVKLLTDDPNVVIYWLVDQKNGGTL